MKSLATTLTGRFESGASERVMTRSGITETGNAGFAVFDIEWHLQLSPDTQLGLSVANLADREYHSITENLLAPGRHLRVNFRYRH